MSDSAYKMTAAVEEEGWGFEPLLKEMGFHLSASSRSVAAPVLQKGESICPHCGLVLPACGRCDCRDD